MRARPLFLLLAAACACAPARLGAQEPYENRLRPAELQAICAGGQVTLWKNGRVSSCVVAGPTSVMGQLVPAGTEVEFFQAPEQADGDYISSYLLGEDAVIRGIRLPAGSRVFPPDAQGMTNIWPSREVAVQGWKCEPVSGGTGFLIYPDGRLRAMHLSRDEDVDGVPCTSRIGLFGGKLLVWLHENGRLQQATVSRDAAIQGHAFRKGDLVSLDPDGRLDAYLPRQETHPHWPPFFNQARKGPAAKPQ
jgi:hypothetical protein